MIEGAEVDGKGVADMVNDSGPRGNWQCVLQWEVEGGNVDRVSSGVQDIGVDGKL